MWAQGRVAEPQVTRVLSAGARRRLAGYAHELCIEVDGYRIQVSRIGPEPLAETSEPVQPRSLESSTSSFEIVGTPPPSLPSYSSAGVPSSPYPLQASGPPSPTPLSPAVDLCPSARPCVRSLFSPAPSSGTPLQSGRARGPPGPSRAEAAEPPLQPPGSQAPGFSASSLPVSSPLRVAEYPLQGPLRPRASIEEGFPPLPKVLCDTCRVLRGSHLTGEERAHRAWRAGRPGREPESLCRCGSCKQGLLYHRC